MERFVLYLLWDIGGEVVLDLTLGDWGDFIGFSIIPD